MNEHYEYIQAICEGEQLLWQYKVKGVPATHMYHDEDVSSWPDSDIITLTKNVLNVEEDDPVKIQVLRY